jgi:hypothetical protein
MNREDFEREFQSSTLAYQPTYRADTRPVVVRVGDDAAGHAGHILLVALANQLARAHQHLVILDTSDHELRCPALFGLTTVADASIGLARAINPHIDVRPELTTDDHPLVTIAIGRTAQPADLRVGCEGWCATFGHDARIGTDATSVLGAMLASCIAASHAFHRVLGDATPPGPAYSLWDYGAPGNAQGPSLDGPLNVGRVLQVGAGGVGAALDYWAALLGITGEWTICDGDDVEVSNLNRQLAFLAAHAGYPHPPALNKATVTADLLGPAATASPHWYDQDPDVTHADYDVVLALANERGIRAALQARQPPVLLHATTSPYWAAQFHRHVAGHDDCINCRIPTATGPPTRCAQTVVNQTTGTDAALPFLSGSAGLMLLAGLIRLQREQLLQTRRNFASLILDADGAHAQQLVRPCNDRCAGWAPPEVRRAMPSTSRYAHLDPARA